MQDLIRQLEQVRTRARLLLVVLRVSSWFTAVLAVVMLAGLGDYLLRLPGWMRLAGLIVGLMVAAGSISTRLRRTLRLKPQLTTLALRLERLYPQAAGRLASAVAFATQAHGEGESTITTQLASTATQQADGQLEGRQIRRLIDPTLTFRQLLAMLLVVGLFTTVAVASPQTVSIAFHRWAMPLGDSAWPNRQQVRSLTDASFAPNNAPLPVRAQVMRGDSARLRVWVEYRFTRDMDGESVVGEWQRALMTRQTPAGPDANAGPNADMGELSDLGVYQRLIEPLPGSTRIELRFEAGDDTTGVQALSLVEPPVLRRLTAHVTPPDYAAKQVVADAHNLLADQLATVAIDALAGSRITLEVVTNKPLPVPDTGADAAEVEAFIRRTFAGLYGVAAESEGEAAARLSPAYRLEPLDSAGVPGWRLTWTLTQPVEMRIRLTDEFGLVREDQRLFRFDVRPDAPPRVTIVEPAADQSVLATAVVPLAAEAQDDVALVKLSLLSRREGAADQSLGVVEATESRAAIKAPFDLSPLQLKAGDELSVVAVAEDNYRLDGAGHDPVESTSRRIRIITPEELARELRTDLADIRSRAARAQTSQQGLAEASPSAGAAQQQRDLADRIGQMRQSVDKLRQRLESNRLNDPPLSQTLSEAGRLTDQARQSAEQAAGRMAQAAEQTQRNQPDQAAEELSRAREQQAGAAAKLQELIELLDQGRDATELKAQLHALAQAQEALAQATRELLPRTLGQNPNQLNPQDRAALQQAAADQRALAEQARQITDRMRTTAAALSRQSQKPDDQATAQALRNAADTATQQELEQQMQQAAQNAQQNQLSQAQQGQQTASQTIQDMLEELGRQEQLRQQMLQRQLAKLADLIAALIERQQSQLDLLAAAQQFDALDEPLLTLRRNTLSVADQARETDERAAPVADHLHAAASHMGEAVKSLREQPVSRPAAEAAERLSLNELNEALKLAKELAEQAQADEAAKERAELIKAYQAVRQGQQAVLDASKQLDRVAADQRDRRFRAESLRVGNEQAELRVKLDEIRQKVNETVAFKAAHEQMDRWASDSELKLRRGEPDGLVVFNQTMIVQSIDSILEALKREQPDEQFADNQEGGNQGGGQGEQGGSPQLIPDAAEVKLLRERQQKLHDVTRAVDEQRDLSAELKRQIVDDLGRQQSGLADTAGQLIRKLQERQQQQQQPPQDLPQP